jgi:hypothetical protein
MLRYVKTSSVRLSSNLWRLYKIGARSGSIEKRLYSRRAHLSLISSTIRSPFLPSIEREPAYTDTYLPQKQDSCRTNT